MSADLNFPILFHIFKDDSQCQFQNNSQLSDLQNVIKKEL